MLAGLAEGVWGSVDGVAGRRVLRVARCSSLRRGGAGLTPTTPAGVLGPRALPALGADGQKRLAI